MVLTESAAYPAFIWGVLGMQRAITNPGLRSDAFALGGIALAFLGRTQFIVLAGILPAAIVLHESLLALRAGGPRALPERLRQTARTHWLLSLAVAGGVLIVAFAGTSVLGTYGTTAETSILPSGLVKSLGGHFDYLVVGIGVVPAVLAAAWCAVTLLKPLDPRSHAFALVLLLTAVVLLVEVTSYDLNFAHGGTQERYLFYLAPLFFAGMAAFLRTRGRSWQAVIVAGVACAAVLQAADYVVTSGPFFSSPETAFH
jgi:hypothetical protein